MKRTRDDVYPGSQFKRPFGSSRGEYSEGIGMTSLSEGRDAPKSMYNLGFIFPEKVNERLCSSEDYQAFLKCLHLYGRGIIKENDLQSLVRDLLGKYPDLVEEFNGFLEHRENMGSS